MLENIIVADSDTESRDKLYEILFSMGYKVECVPNSNEALLRLQNERPNVLILEQDLPPAGAFETLKKIREFDQDIKVVILTKDKPDQEIVNRGSGLGVAAIATKDFSTHFMIKKILEIITESRELSKDNKYPSSAKILVVDDAQEVRMILTQFLTAKGFEVKEAASGDQALMDLKIEKPKLVLLDERMPGMDGLVVLKKIKQIDDSIKVVMITGVEDRDVIDEAYKLGASDYVIKPFDFKKVEALVLSLLTVS